MTGRKEKTVLSNRILRYGYARHMYRVVLVHINANENTAGEALHEVHALRMDGSGPCMWWVGDDALPRVLNRDVRA